MRRIAIQGVAGSYSEEATRELFGADVTIVECSDFEHAFSALRLGNAELAVIPVENKLVGEIQGTASLLRSNQFKVLETLTLDVRHVLAGTHESELDELLSVRSHVEALKQCRSFLERYPAIIQEIGADTASSVRRVVRDGDRTKGAICSRRAADMYGAKVLCDEVADDKDNWTVFYAIGN
jgi:prephenate dehydratase